jgi:hemoglobin-like flavoprotein
MSHPVETSLTLVSERCGDLSPLVYERLFREHPEMTALFWRDKTGTIKGEMLARVFDAVLDYIGDNRYAAHMIKCEVVTHSQYDVPPEVFGTFFTVVVATIREQLGQDWTPEFEAAWQKLLREFDRFVRSGAQTATA